MQAFLLDYELWRECIYPLLNNSSVTGNDDINKH